MDRGKIGPSSTAVSAEDALTQALTATGWKIAERSRSQDRGDLVDAEGRPVAGLTPVDLDHCPECGRRLTGLEWSAGMILDSWGRIKVVGDGIRGYSANPCGHRLSEGFGQAIETRDVERQWTASLEVWRG